MQVTHSLKFSTAQALINKVLQKNKIKKILIKTSAIITNWRFIHVYKENREKLYCDYNLTYKINVAHILQ